LELQTLEEEEEEEEEQVLRGWCHPPLCQNADPYPPLRLWGTAGAGITTPALTLFTTSLLLKKGEEEEECR
jgi:hypothetical protein